MPEVTSATPAAPVTAAAPAEQAKVAAPEVKKLKFQFPDLGEVELPESDVAGVLSQFAKMKKEDFAAKQRLEELEPAFDDDSKLEELLKKRGKDPAKLAEAWLKKAVQAQLDEATLTPDQKRIKELEARDAAREAERASEKKKSDSAAFEAQVKEEFAKLSAIADAALKETSLPEELKGHPEVRRRLGSLMKRNAELNADVPPSVLAKQLEATLVQEHDYVFTKFSPETLYKRLGRKGVEGLIRLYAAEMAPKTEETKVARRQEASGNASVTELRRKVSEIQYQRAREEQQLLRGGASGRENRYYGKR